MANISFFYPKAEKGAALGLNAGLGNLGVSGMQLIAPLVIATSVFGPISGDPKASGWWGGLAAKWALAMDSAHSGLSH